jgi:glycine/D-amino acid oxidase-like deaminating enzyme
MWQDYSWLRTGSSARLEQEERVVSNTVFERQPADPAAVAKALSTARQGSFWLDDVSAEPFGESLRGTQRADIAIVGAGYLGLWTALLAQRRYPGSRVVVIEAKTVGWAASGRNGGFCEASLTHGLENGQRRWPEELDTLNRLGLENLDAIENEGIDCDFERNGALSVATEEHQLDWIREPDTDDEVYLDRDAVQREVHSTSYLGARWDKRGSAILHPAKLSRGLAERAAGLGVEFFEHSPVRRLVNDGERVRVETATGVVNAAKVVLATNAFPSLLKRNALMTVPVYDYALMTEPLSDEQLTSIGWSNRQGIGDLANQFHYYRLSADNRILFGGYDALYHYGARVRESYESNEAPFTKLAGHFLTTFPQLEGLAFTHRWAGAIDTCTRFCAYYGTARGGRVAYAAGFTGLGVAATRFAAEVLLDKLAGETTERTELRMVRERPLPFPPEPAAAIGINLTRGSLDRADHRGGRRNLLLKTLDALGLGFDS